MIKNEGRDRLTLRIIWKSITILMLTSPAAASF